MKAKIIFDILAKVLPRIAYISVGLALAVVITKTGGVYLACTMAFLVSVLVMIFCAYLLLEIEEKKREIKDLEKKLEECLKEYNTIRWKQ